MITQRHNPAYRPAYFVTIQSHVELNRYFYQLKMIYWIIFFIGNSYKASELFILCMATKNLNSHDGMS